MMSKACSALVVNILSIFGLLLLKIYIVLYDVSKLITLNNAATAYECDSRAVFLQYGCSEVTAATVNQVDYSRTVNLRCCC